MSIKQHPGKQIRRKDAIDQGNHENIHKYVKGNEGQQIKSFCIWKMSRCTIPNFIPVEVTSHNSYVPAYIPPTLPHPKYFLHWHEILGSRISSKLHIQKQLHNLQCTCKSHSKMLNVKMIHNQWKN